MEEIEYKRYLVSFLDVLGFKKKVDSYKANKIFRILNSFRLAKEIIPGYNGEPMFADVVAFSDMALRVTEINPNIGKMLFDIYIEILTLETIQFRLAKEDVFIRGGITIGDLYFNKIEGEQFAFGPAFNKAYEIEREISIYPRVVCDPELFSKIMESLPLTGEVISMFPPGEIKKKLRKDFDGLLHIDYLRHSLEHPDNAKEGAEFLKDHKASIEKGVHENKDNLRVLTKYYWLINYHNSYISSLNDKKLSELRAARDELLVILEG